MNIRQLQEKQICNIVTLATTVYTIHHNKDALQRETRLLVVTIAFTPRALHIAYCWCLMMLIVVDIGESTEKWLFVVSFMSF